MKTVIITMVIMVALIVGVKYFSPDQVEQTVGSTQVSEDVDTGLVSSGVEIVGNNFDVGDIPIGGGNIDAEFSFKNIGSETLKLTHGSTSCMCTEAVILKKDGEMSPRIKMPGHGSSGDMSMELAPGEEAVLTATFDPMAHGPNALGPITRDVILKTNSKTDPQTAPSAKRIP